MPEDKTTQSSSAKTHREPWGAACTAMTEGNQQVVARWMRALLALTQEITQFTHNRLEEDAAAWSALSACRSPEEAMECQRRIAAKATAQYYDEIEKLSQMMMRAAGESFGSLQHRPGANP